MSSLADNGIDIFIGKVNFLFLNFCFFCIFLNRNANINQAAAERFRTFSILPLMSFINDDGKLASTEFFHIFLGKKEFLNRTNDNSLFIVDCFCKASGILFIINRFHQANLMLKTIDGILELIV